MNYLRRFKSIFRLRCVVQFFILLLLPNKVNILLAFLLNVLIWNVLLNWFESSIFSSLEIDCKKSELIRKINFEFLISWNSYIILWLYNRLLILLFEMTWELYFVHCGSFYCCFEHKNIFFLLQKIKIKI